MIKEFWKSVHICYCKTATVHCGWRKTFVDRCLFSIV